MIEEWNWELVNGRVEEFIKEMGLPELALAPISSAEDVMPSDLSGLPGNKLSNKLSEYSAYVSYLNAELGRIDSQRISIQSEIDSAIFSTAHAKSLSRPKARTLILSEHAHLKKGDMRLTELNAVYARVFGIKEGFAVRMQAVSREISRRAQDK